VPADAGRQRLVTRDQLVLVSGEWSQIVVAHVAVCAAGRPDRNHADF
jgi:hypothetical protein